MDISFHYYAVKSVARAAGYPEEKAQRIASYSQFVDDYNWYVYFRANNIPGYVKSPDLDIVYNDLLSIVNPVTTGFSDWFDMTTLMLSRSQKFTVCPFHFIPQNRQRQEAGDNRVVPAVLDDGSYIADMLAAIKQEITSGAAADPTSENYALMRMGALCHVFADTYAHQLFTGFNNTTNSVELLSATDNTTGKDVTEQYHFWIEKWIARIESIIKVKMPTIGHMAIAHIPDLSHLSFSMKYHDMQGKELIHTRSNTETFVRTCRELYTFFRSCLGDAVAPNSPWDDLQPKLAKGFLLDAAKELNDGEKAAIKVLTPHWSIIFPEYTYSYDSDAIKKGFMLSSAPMLATPDDMKTVEVEGETMNLVSKTYSDDFYQFSLFADQHLIALYGAHPRNWLSDEQPTP